jgi:hypothetical protein
MGELQAGIERTRRQDARKARQIELWADQLAASYSVLPMDSICFREFGRIMDRKPDQLIEDAVIAATARVHDLGAWSKQQRFKTRTCGLLQAIPFFNRNQDRGLNAAPGHNLRPLFEGCVQELAKSSFCILYLPRSHVRPRCQFY